MPVRFEVVEGDAARLLYTRGPGQVDCTQRRHALERLRIREQCARLNHSLPASRGCVGRGGCGEGQPPGVLCGAGPESAAAATAKHEERVVFPDRALRTHTRTQTRARATHVNRRNSPQAMPARTDAKQRAVGLPSAGAAAVHVSVAKFSAKLSS
jgi:hypothetical protein